MKKRKKQSRLVLVAKFELVQGASYRFDDLIVPNFVVLHSPVALQMKVFHSKGGRVYWWKFKKVKRARTR